MFIHNFLKGWWLPGFANSSTRNVDAIEYLMRKKSTRVRAKVWLKELILVVVAETNAQSTASATNPHEEFKMRKTTLQFNARNDWFSDNDQL